MTIAMPSDASTFIQWKGTNVCMDLRCFCGHTNHYDQQFLYFAQCHKCKTVFELGTEVSLRVASPDQFDGCDVGQDVVGGL